MQTYAYTVRAEKLGYTSPLSNEIRVNTTTASVAQNAEAGYKIVVENRKLNIMNQTNTNLSVTLCLPDGKTIKEISITGPSTSISLQKGIYILTINQSHRKIIVQ
jgi:hypothetical protein